MGERIGPEVNEVTYWRKGGQLCGHGIQSSSSQRRFGPSLLVYAAQPLLTEFEVYPSRSTRRLACILIRQKAQQGVCCTQALASADDLAAEQLKKPS